MNKYAFRLLAAVVVSQATLTAHAATDYVFGTRIDGNANGSPDLGSFAQLSVTQIDADTLGFTLNLGSLATASHSSGGFVGSMVTRTTSGRIGWVDPGSVSGDVAVVSTSPGRGPDGPWDFRFVFGSHGSHDRLTGNESVSWTTSFADPTAFAAAALHVQGQAGAGWYQATAAVPEPQSYAMLLAGLGVIGLIARRRISAI